MSKIYTGQVYKAPSGQWAWIIREGDEDVVRGAGYDSEDDAQEDMEAELAEYQARDAGGNRDDF